MKALRKTALKVVSTAALAAVILGFSAPRFAHRYMLKVGRADFQAHINEIRGQGIDVAGVNLQSGLVYLLVNESERSKLAELGIKVNGGVSSEVILTAPDAKYKTPQQVGELLQKLAADHPGLASVSSIGKSLEGRDIFAIKITKDADKPGPAKPAVFYNGMHHAREVMSAEVPLDIATYLLENYGKDARVTHWLDSFEIHVLPMLNVDGNNKVWTENSMWRKNARGESGVDINRNYPYAWNSCQGASDDESAQDYRGPSAASEPETNVFMKFAASIHPVFSISFHSFSELVIYPYGCGNHAEKKDVVEPLGDKMAQLVPSDSGNGHYTAGVAPDLLYSVDGDDIDWLYHEQSTIAYVIELNSAEQGFQPDFDGWREKTVTKLRPAWQLLLERMDGPSIRGQVRAAALAGQAARIHVSGLGALASYTQDYKTAADGSFTLILNPGDYRLTVGGAKREVHVGDSPVQIEL